MLILSYICSIGTPGETPPRPYLIEVPTSPSPPDERSCYTSENADRLPPEGLDEIARRITQLEIEREAIRREDDEVKLEELNKEIATLREEEAGDKAKWMRKQERINRIQQCKIEVDSAERSGGYGHVAEICYGRLKEKGPRSPRSNRSSPRLRAIAPSSARRSLPRISPTSSLAGWGFPWARCSRASRRSSYFSRKSYTRVSLGRGRLYVPCAVVVQACRIPSAPSDRSSS